MGDDYIVKILCEKNIRDIWLNVEDVLKAGVTADELLDLGEPYGGYFVERAETILSLGASPKKLFDINEGYYVFITNQPKELIPELSKYVEYGLDPEFIIDWVKIHVSALGIVENAEGFRSLGIHPEDYIQAYLDYFNFGCLWDEVMFGNLPNIISLKDVIEYYTVKEIEKQFHGSHYGCEKFIKEYKKVGGDINVLARKFLVHYGYPEDEYVLMILALLLQNGAIRIEADRIIDALTYQAYIYKDSASIKATNERFREILKGHVGTARLAKLER